MRRHWFRVFGLVIACCGAACTSGSPRIKPNLTVPTEFQNQPFEPPTGESERVRYLKAYEAFWYNCITLLSEDISAQCPSTCSGTPATAAGCANGGREAWSQIRASVESYGELRTREELRAIARQLENQAKMAAYFGERPVEEYAPRR
jgi:hypothetical protein